MSPERITYALLIEGETVLERSYALGRRGETIPSPFQAAGSVAVSTALDLARPRRDRYGYPIAFVRFEVQRDGAPLVRSFASRPFVGPVEES